MVVYVDGKPIFVKNSDVNASFVASQDANRKPAPAKIPYLLAVATATAGSSQQPIIDSGQFIRQENDSRVKSRKRLHSQTSDSKETGSDTEQDYIELVSMFKQKNQKLSSALFK